MKHSQETFMDLVNEAYEGTLKLPAFQRDFKWERSKIISLYDSLRKPFPIGNFLFLETSSEYNLSPRAFKRASNKAEKSESKRLVLDGQQRITSGISLLYGESSDGKTFRFFIDLKALKELADKQEVNYEDDASVKKFLQETDDGDNYIIATRKTGELKTLLLEKHWLSTTYLKSKVKAQRALEDYEEKHPDTKEFLKYLVAPYFSLDNDFKIPVVTLDKNESLVAVTRIFATINTTGKRLTPVEIVTATLFASDINLKKKVEEYHEVSSCLKHMDPIGEILLQTIALLAKKTPKKSLLPKTITEERFRLYCEEALDLLNEVGEFLSKKLGVGLTETNKLIPYDSILAPMAVVYQTIKKKKLSGANKNAALNKLEKWFIGSALAQRYQEGVHNKQDNDWKEFNRWVLENNDKSMPVWLREVQVPKKIKHASPNGAIGRMIKCLLNIEKPWDPIEDIQVGYFDEANEIPQEHHIWPNKFCIDHLLDWDKEIDSPDSILNIIHVSLKTNKSWDKMNPADQIAAIRAKHPNVAKQKEIFNKLLLSDKCIEIMNRPSSKTRDDFFEFIDERFKYIAEKLSLWGFSIGDEEIEDEPMDE